MKTALILGIAGQDGSFLAEFLLEKNYNVHGLMKMTSSSDRQDNPIFSKCVKNLKLHFADSSDLGSLISIFKAVKPDEVYNLAAQSHLQLSFELPELTMIQNGMSPLLILETIRILDLKTKIFHAGSSELYAKKQPEGLKLNETHAMYPTSPYAVSKLFAHWMMINYRESYGIYTVNGILFNHESEIRPEAFVTRKITRSVVRIKQKKQECLFLGNLDSHRDWSHARDFVEGMWMSLQQKEGGEYCFASGETHTVREFCEIAFKHVGLPITWKGERGTSKEYAEDPNGNIVLKIDEKFFRPGLIENSVICGDVSKAKRILGWIPKISFAEMVARMIKIDLE
jgi:GDPmannose 4,6-dehydratase